MNLCERELSTVSFGEGIISIRVEEYCQKSVCPVCVVGI